MEFEKYDPQSQRDRFKAWMNLQVPGNISGTFEHGQFYLLQMHTEKVINFIQFPDADSLRSVAMQMLKNAEEWKQGKLLDCDL